MYTVFSHSANWSYKTSVCSKVTIFYAITTILTFVAPLLIAYRSQGFWQRVDTYEEQPDIHFEHELLILLETADADNTFGWSTFPNFNALLDDKIRTPKIQSTETDWNRDGKLDYIDMKIDVPVDDTETIYGFQLFLLFDVRLYKFSTFHMQGLIYLTASSGLPTTGLTVTGDLIMVQKQPLAHKGFDDRFSKPIFNKTSIFADVFRFDRIIHEYSQQNVSLRLSNDYTIWERGSTGLGSPFELKLRFNYPLQTLTYYSGFWQMLKWAWVQYMSILIVFIYFFRQVKTFVFSRQVLPSVVAAPFSKKDK